MIIHIDNKTMKCQKYIKGIVICLLVLVPREILYLHGSIEEHHNHLHGLCDFCPALTKLALDLHVNLAMLFVVCLYGVRSFFSRLYLSKRPSSFCLIHFWGSSGAAPGQNRTFEGRRPLKEDDLWRKTTFYGRRPLTEDDLWQKTIFDGGRPFREDNLWL